jgi:Protein kinase domain
MARSREGFTVRIQRGESAAPAGIGFVVDDMRIITCAHVVNAALGRDPQTQEPPDPQARVQVDFPMLGGPAGARSRSCAVQAWVPPPSRGLRGGDVAGLVLPDEGLPEHSSPAGLADPMVWDVSASVFGCPGDPPRPEEGAWAEVKLQGMTDGGVIRFDAGSETVIGLQPGYSGSPVVMTSGTGVDTVLGMLAVASTDKLRGICAIPVSELARAWPDVIDAGQLRASPDIRMRGRNIAQRYQLQAPVGRGSMGVVWRARDLPLDRDVAVKEVVISAMISADERRNAYRRTLREARTAGRLDHRAIVSIYDVCEDEGRPWIVMQLVDGPSLDQVLASSGSFSPRKAAEVGLQLLSGLSMAHAAGVLHRDVKPGNVLLGRDDPVVLTDFGIAAFHGDPRITQDGFVMGSPGFTAPERIRGGQATPASDLWSLGATLFAAVEGAQPLRRTRRRDCHHDRHRQRGCAAGACRGPAGTSNRRPAAPKPGRATGCSRGHTADNQRVPARTRSSAGWR